MAGRNIVRHFGLAFSASCAVSITLILISVFLLITANVNSFTHNIEQQVTIRASIDTIVKDSQKQKMLAKIKQLPQVASVKLSTGKEELESYKQEYHEDETLFDMYDGKANPIRDTFIIEVKKGQDITKTAAQIKEIKGIVNAEYGGESTASMLSAFTAIRSGGVIFIIFLVVVAIFLISNKIKMSIYTRKHEIAIMRYVGASNWCIKFPMMLEGIFIGLLGSVVPILLTIFAYHYAYQALNGNLMSSMFVMQAPFPMVGNISLLLLGIGVIVGLSGSFFSTTRYLHWKR